MLPSPPWVHLHEERHTAVLHPPSTSCGLPQPTGLTRGGRQHPAGSGRRFQDGLRPRGPWVRASVGVWAGSRTQVACRGPCSRTRQPGLTPLPCLPALRCGSDRSRVLSAHMCTYMRTYSRPLVLQGLVPGPPTDSEVCGYQNPGMLKSFIENGVNTGM